MRCCTLAGRVCPPVLVQPQALDLARGSADKPGDPEAGGGVDRRGVRVIGLEAVGLLVVIPTAFLRPRCTQPDKTD